MIHVQSALTAGLAAHTLTTTVAGSAFEDLLWSVAAAVLSAVLTWLTNRKKE
jgi:hypothetical protein